MMLLTKKSPLNFSHEVISNLIEQLNIYGTSIDKFRRMLKLMIVEYVYKNDHLPIHLALGKDYKNLIRNKPDDPHKSETNKTNLKSINDKIAKFLAKMPDQYFPRGRYSKDDIERGILKDIEAYVYLKRQWFKAAEVLIEMVTTANDE